MGIIGGDLTSTTSVDVHHGDRSCSSIIVKGSSPNSNKWRQTHVIVDPDYDMSYYEKHKENLRIKSKYWATLPTTPGTNVKDPASNWGETKFECSRDDEIQVFNIQKKHVNPAYNYRFTNCKGKTILINVHGTGKIDVKGVDSYDSDGNFGFLPGSGFDTCMIASMLWNFPDADNVELKGPSEFQGYPFAPPKPLPDPDCADFVAQAPSTKHTYPPAAEPTTPTKNPTKAPKPTSAPEPDNTPSQPGCVPKPYCDDEPDFPDCLPKSVGKPSLNDCKAYIGGSRTWDPCAGRGWPTQQVCYGDDCVLY